MVKNIRERVLQTNKIGVKINMNQAKNIDQTEQINQTIGSIVLSRATTTKVEKTKDLRTRTAGIEKG